MWYSLANIHLGQEFFVFVFRKHLENVLKAFWSKPIYSPCHTPSEDALKMSWKCLYQDEYIRLSHTSSRHLQHLFKTFWGRVQGVLPKRLQDVLQKCLQDILPRRFEDAFKTSSKRLEKLSSGRLQDVLKTSSRCIIN